MKMNESGPGSFTKKKVFGSLTMMQLLMMVLAAIIGITILRIGGFGGSPVGWLLTAVIIYMIPHVFGADFKAKLGFLVVFSVAAIAIGGAVVGPSFVDENSRESVSDRGAFSNVTYSYDESTESITVDADWDIGTYTGTDAYLCHAEVTLVPFNSAPMIGELEKELIPSATGSTHFTFVLGGIDGSKLYDLVLVVGQTVDGKVEIDEDSASTATLTGFTGADTTGPCFMGAACVMLYVALIFLMILVFSFLIRRTIKGKRKEMEDSGRLYPQGYGRCTKCGALVLPGEIKCRKCGEYIDRPEEMKHKKIDFFQCSVCGAEVPGDADVCPKCGAKFDGVENVVSHPDGKVDVSEECIACPGCGESVPANADFCPKCGRKF